MTRGKYILMLLAFAATALWGIAQPTEEEHEQQRQRLEAARKHPEELARLRENLKSFQNLPEKKRGAIVKLDRDLHDLPASEKARLTTTLEAYAQWLDRLRLKDAAAYQAIKEAPDAATRLALIKDRRDRDWLDLQPKAQQDQWKALQGEARSAFVAKLRQEHRQNHQQWELAKKFWDELEVKKRPLPCRLSDFSEKVKGYVNDYLLPYLSDEEKKQLKSAEGRWPDYPIALVEVAGKRPSALPSDSKPIKRIIDLPEPVQHKLFDRAAKFIDKGPIDKKSKATRVYGLLKQNEGRFFESKLVEIALREKRYPFGHEFLAANENALSEPMQAFMEKTLMPALKDQADKRKLVDTLGKWPDYPLAIQDLARKHNLQPPWHILPEPDRWKWDLYRDVKVRSWGSEIAKDRKPPP